MAIREDMDDGIIKGYIMGDRKPCGICAFFTNVIRVQKVTLPDKIKPDQRLILYQKGLKDPSELVHIHQVGIGCGCYAKAHRQIAYVKANIRSRT